MTALELLKDQMKRARDTFEGTVADIKDEHLHADPGGKALPLGSIYAHLILSEDAIVNGMLQKKAPLSASEWEGKTGIDKPMPSWENPDWEKENREWSKSIVVDLPQLQKYAEAVYSSTDEYLNSLSDEDLEKEMDLGAMGKQTLANVISGFLIGHTNNITGEISVLKGVQGEKGYQF
jgi:hypothetical protein